MQNFVGPVYDILKQALSRNSVRYVNDLGGSHFTLCVGDWSQPVSCYYDSTVLGKRITIKHNGKSASFVPQANLQYIVQKDSIKIVGGGSIPWS
jgi:hypothetical protein